MTKCEFDSAMIEQCKLMISECKKVGSPYRPRYLQAMIGEKGGYASAKELLSKDDPQSGFTELFLEGLLGCTVEALVLQPRWSGLFTNAEIAEARRRLEERGYKVDA